MSNLGKSPYQAFGLIGVGTFDPRLDVLVTSSTTHVLALWFARLSSGWEVVAFDATPAAGRSTWEKGLPSLIEWLRPSGARLASLLDQGKVLVPISQADIRGVPLRAASTHRAQTLLRSAMETATDLVPAEGLARRAEQQLGLLQDAFDYEHARRVGVAPSALIAIRRGISEQSAEQRIVRTRIAGFLRDEPDKNGSYLPAVAFMARKKLAHGTA